MRTNYCELARLKRKEVSNQQVAVIMNLSRNARIESHDKQLKAVVAGVKSNPYPIKNLSQSLSIKLREYKRIKFNLITQSKVGS